MKKTWLTALLAASVTLLSACDNHNDNKIKVAINTGPDEALWQTVKQVAHDKYQLDVDVVAFNDYVQPNEALFNKDVDANAFQSLPYLEMQSKERGYKFAVVTNTFVFPIAGYSRKIKSLQDLPDGATVTVSNEATTLGRSLLLLQAQGLLKVKPEAGLLPTTLDIPQVYLSIINNNFASLVNLSASRDGMFMEGKASPYVNAIVAREDNKDSPNVQKLKEAFQSQPVLDKANEIYKGDIIKGW